MNLREDLRSYLDEKEIDKLWDSLKEKDTHAVLLNTKKMSKETFLSLFPNVIPHPLVENAFLYDEDVYQLGKNVYHDLGCFYIQDPSAMIPAYILNAKPGDIVLDLCAAPGGKSVQTAMNMVDEGLLIANDISSSRVQTILENVERLGLGNVIIVNNDFSKIHQYFEGYFDKIILDAPCSGSGMIRKDPRMLDDWSENKVQKFAELQKDLILYSYDMLKDGGDMVYSTCSFSQKENEDVIAYLLENRDAEVVSIDKEELFFVHKNLPYGYHTFMHLFPGEGQYFCLIHKPGKKNDNVITPRYEYRFNDYLLNVSYELPIKLKKQLHIIREGVKVGEYIKNIFKYDYHYAHYLTKFDNEIELNDEEIVAWFMGNVINKGLNDGYILIKYNGIPVSFGKVSNHQIKNYLPKGLRHKINV